MIVTGVNEDYTDTNFEINDYVITGFNEKLKELNNAKPFAKPNYIAKLQAFVDMIAGSDKGLKFLYDKSPELEAAGIFQGTVWEAPQKLLPALVGGTLKSDPNLSLMEILSELRILSYAKGENPNKGMTKEQADAFLETALVNNLDIVFPGAGTEEDRELNTKVYSRAVRLFQFLINEIPVEGIKERLADEIEAICAQRQISVERVKEMIQLANEKFKLNPNNPGDQKLMKYVRALTNPTKNTSKFSLKHSLLGKYEEFLSGLSPRSFEYECKTLASSIEETGLVSPYHAIALKVARNQHQDLIPDLLDLDDTGAAEYFKHQNFILQLIDKAIDVETEQSIYGLSQMIERGLFSREPVMNGLQKLLNLQLHPEVVKNLQKLPAKKYSSPLKQLLAGTLSVLGQPLGIGQGWNPTCQTARGISLWSEHAPGKLLNLIIAAARNNDLEFRFEGDLIKSSEVLDGVAKRIDFKLDAVSVVLVPHIDKIYNEMMRRASFRHDDPHKWVNPALYGQWIPTGFKCAYNQLTDSITHYEEFVRTFYATHHPEYNGGNNLVYPNPVGIFITAPRGKFLGFHAISLLRVSKSQKGEWRIYFLNPNNEGRQAWEDNIKPEVMGNGERPGESSLPFYQLASRIYAFHYNPSEVGDLSAIDNIDVQRVITLAKESWGKSYKWA